MLQNDVWLHTIDISTFFPLNMPRLAKTQHLQTTFPPLGPARHVLLPDYFFFSRPSCSSQPQEPPPVSPEAVKSGSEPPKREKWSMTGDPGVHRPEARPPHGSTCVVGHAPEFVNNDANVRGLPPVGLHVLRGNCLCDQIYFGGHQCVSTSKGVIITRQEEACSEDVEKPTTQVVPSVSETASHPGRHCDAGRFVPAVLHSCVPHHTPSLSSCMAARPSTPASLASASFQRPAATTLFTSTRHNEYQTIRHGVIPPVRG